MKSTRVNRILSAVLSLAIVIGITTISRETVLADTDTTLGLTYTITDGVATITGFTAPAGFSGTLVIPNTLGDASVTSIENYAFSWCKSLTSITIPSSVTSIGDSAFLVCSSLTSITIPDGVTSIGNDAFWGCSSLTSITIPSSVTSIGDGAFSGCSSLTSITIPSGVTSIGDYAFSECSNLTSITIPSSVTSIGDYAFGWCDSLTSITIPSSVTSIGEYAFYACSSLTLITVDAANTAYKSVDGLLLTKDGTKLICCPAGKSGSITIPSSVTSIGDYAFAYCSNLTSITIPSSVTSIGDGAFYSCDSLTSITIPSSVTSIGDQAFAYCSSLTSITIPSGVTSIGDYAFYGCDSLTSITILSGVTSIGDQAFAYCSSLTSITIPSGATSIGYQAFSYCSSLTNIMIPSGVTSIGAEAFYYCTSLSVVTLPGTVTSLGSYAFDIGADKQIKFIVPTDKITYYQSLLNTNVMGTTTAVVTDKYTVTFDTNGGIAGTGSDYTQQIAIDGLASAPVNPPTRMGYVFDGWYTDADCTIAWDFNTDVVTSSITLYAKWKSNSYLVTFNTQGGSELTSISANYGTKISVPTAPTKAGYIFGGWYKNAICTQAWIFNSDMITKDTILYAKWTLSNTGAFITRFYDLCLGREPDAGGLTYWVDSLLSGSLTGANAAYNFVFSTEFLNRNVTDNEYLTIMYHAFFNRDPDAGGAAYWQAYLDNGMSRYWILSNFVNSEEFKNICNTYGITAGSLAITAPVDKYPQITQFVTRFYKLCLDRMPDAAGLDHWVVQLQTQNLAGANVAHDIVTSEEFTNRGTTNDEFVEIMYKAFFDRASEASGKAYWTGRLAAGASRYTVLTGFVNSQEFTNICSSYGINRGSM